MLHVPLTTFSAAFTNKSTNLAPALSSTLDVQLPENSPPRPLTFARHAPVHPSLAFTADHPPNATVLPSPPDSVHVPVTVPCAVSGTAVQVPMYAALPLVALHVPDRAPGKRPAESSRTTACALEMSTAARSSRHARENAFTEFSGGRCEKRPDAT